MDGAGLERVPEPRARGLDFDLTWPLAVARGLAVAGGKGSASTFAWSRETWRGAYERREPARGERLRVEPSDFLRAT